MIKLNSVKNGSIIVDSLFLTSMIPTILNLVKNLVLNKRFKTEFFNGIFCQNIQNSVTENNWQDFLTNFKRKNFNRKAIKQKIRLKRIN